VFVSAHSGSGIDELRVAIAERLPRPAAELWICLPYDRGDLVARIHRRGQVLQTRHTEDGTELHVRVDQQIAAELAPFRR
jgi:GTP-binding protein HflX